MLWYLVSVRVFFFYSLFLRCRRLLKRMVCSWAQQFCQHKFNFFLSFDVIFMLYYVLRGWRWIYLDKTNGLTECEKYTRQCLNWKVDNKDMTNWKLKALLYFYCMYFFFGNIKEIVFIHVLVQSISFNLMYNISTIQTNTNNKKSKVKCQNEKIKKHCL